MTSTTGENIAKNIIDHVLGIGICLDGLIAQGYDGASNMAGHIRGCQIRIKSVYLLAEYFHCASHRVNLAICDAAATRSIAYLISDIKEVF